VFGRTSTTSYVVVVVVVVVRTSSYVRTYDDDGDGVEDEGRE